MNKLMTKVVFIAALFFIAVNPLYSQGTSKVEKAVNELVNKYDGKDQVDCMVVTKGNGLELLKIALNKQLGNSFMKGVNSITVIDYSDASKQTCEALRKDLDAFLVHLKEFDVSKEKQFSDNKYIRCFASEDGGVLSDFILALENDDSKTVMYMAGKIVVE